MLFKNLSVEKWGLVPYKEAFDRQQAYLSEIIKGQRQETLVFCQHPPVVTLGRGTKDGDVFSWTGSTEVVNRGGRATYHGPSQIVFYPLVSLDPQYNLDFPCRRDLHGFIRLLEESVVATLKDFGITGEGHSLQKQVGDDSEKNATGVWVAGKKIASIGIAIKKWVSSHGLALNLTEDPSAFQGINPCGFQSSQMTSLEKELGRTVSRDVVEEKILSHYLARVCSGTVN